MANFTTLLRKCLRFFENANSKSLNFWEVGKRSYVRNRECK